MVSFGLFSFINGCESRTEFGLILFHSTQEAIRAEKVLLTDGLRLKLIPVPRHISSQCGMALRFEWALREGVQASLETQGAGFNRILKL